MDLGRHLPGREHVPGHAVRVRIGRGRAKLACNQRRAADRLARRGIGNDVERSAEARDRDVVAILPIETDAAEQIACVITDAAPEVALEASEQPNALVLEIVLDRTAFDIAQGDQEPAAIICPSRHRIDERRRRADHLHQIAIVVQGRDFADEIACSANQRPLLIGQQRIVAIDRLGIREISRWTDLPDRSVLHRHHFGIGLDRAGKIEICEAAGGISLVRPLDEVPRTDIESTSGRERTSGRA